MAKPNKKSNKAGDKPAEASTDAVAPVEAQAAEPAGASGDLQAQLDAALAEVSALKLELASKENEISALKQGKPVPVPSSDDTQKLQENLIALRKQQAEADSAREAAWRQLKSVVAEITRLAGPDASSKAMPAVSTPTGTAQAV